MFFFCKEIIKKMTIEYKFFVQILTLFEAVPFFDILCGKNLSSFLYVELVIIFNNIFFHKLKNKPIMFQQFHRHDHEHLSAVLFGPKFCANIGAKANSYCSIKLMFEAGNFY